LLLVCQELDLRYLRIASVNIQMPDVSVNFFIPFNMNEWSFIQ